MNNKKIIPFQPNGDFHFKSGMKKIEQNKKQEALVSFEKAYDSDEDNLSFIAQYVFLLAETGRVTEAENLIMDKFVQHQYDAEFYFIMSQMYMVLGDANKSFLYGMVYSKHFPEENYDEELASLFEIDIQDEGEVMEEAELFVGQQIFQHLFMNAKIEEALEYLSFLPLEVQETKMFRNSRAMALLFVNKFEEAYKILERLLKEDQTDMHALSHMTLLYYHTDQKEQYEMSLKKLEVVQPLNDDDKFKVGLVLNFLKKYDRSYELLYPLYKRNEFISFQLLHALSHASYHVGKVEESKDIWGKMQTFFNVPEAQSPWVLDAAVQEIIAISEKYLLHDDLSMRLLGIFYLSTVNPNDAIFGHSVWDTIDDMGDYEKLYISYIYRGIAVPRLDKLHEGLVTLDHMFNSDDGLLEFWINIYHDAYDRGIRMDELAPYLAVTLYVYEETMSQKQCFETFNISRYKFNKAYDALFENE